MKRIFTIIIFISQISLEASSQNGAAFKYRFKPKRIYIQLIDQKEKSETTYKVDSSFKEKLKENKLKEFDSSENVQHIETRISTDHLLNDSIFKMTIEFTKTLNNNKPILSNNLKLFTHCNTNLFLPKIDSISNPLFANNNSDLILELTKKALLQIDFPEKKLAIGEAFYKTYPLTFPGKDNELIVVYVGTGYKLLKIENGIAMFEIKQFYKINLGASKVRPIITTEGSGKLFYDIKENFYREYYLNTKFVYKVKKENYTVETTSTSNISNKAIIISR